MNPDAASLSALERACNPKRVHVRICVAVARDGTWAVFGSSCESTDESRELARGAVHTDAPVRYFWLAADLPYPEKEPLTVLISEDVGDGDLPDEPKKSAKRTRGYVLGPEVKLRMSLAAKERWRIKKLAQAALDAPSK